jgi:hypothetical protein
MTTDKRIIIGCDNAVNLTAVLDSMKETTLFNHNIITLTRPEDIAGMVRTFNPDLLLLCFRNNQFIIDKLNSTGKRIDVPIFCLTGKWETETLSWHKHNIVFTCPLEHIYNTAYLHGRINSIFILVNETSKKVARAVPAHTTNGQGDAGNGRAVSRYIMELEQKTEMLLKIRDRLSYLFSQVDGPVKAELVSVVNFIKMYANNYDLWGDFKLLFDQTDPEFLPALARKFPLLTTIDLKYCCYVKMNMTNDDIKNVFGISLESVRTHKYRLKKKLALARDKDLRNYLLSLG